MADSANLPPLRIVGTASCVGGKHPDPPIDKHPLLCWGVSHPVHGSKVFTNDQRASVEDIAIAACETPNLDTLAAKFGTTAEHVRQAIDYALAAKFLG
jgi:uncharacterized protein (DUF433 family)